MLLESQKPGDVHRYIKEQTNAEESLMTIDKYCQMYRRFFLTPMDYLRHQNARAESGSVPALPEPRSIGARKLSQITDKIQEIQDLQEIARVQRDRIEKLTELEARLGLPIPDLSKEIQIAAEMVNTLIGRQMDFGLLMRVPQRFAGR